ncbi:MAG: succinate dehydrogenase, cytochrome b556 subunit [Anaerolineales bacterium]|nr:succinate dehydrogenase, cytochrome b556 subunit [Anaerolineales bacterium]
MQAEKSTRPRQVWQWADVRRRKLGMWAYTLNRVSGLGLVLYLFIHLAVLRLLAGGPAAWDNFLALVRSPLFLVLDVVLLAGLLIHGLNGIRLTITGLGIGVPAHKTWFLALMAAALILSAAGAIAIFTM